MNKIITKANTILDCVGKALHNTFGILFGGKTFIKTIPSYEEIIVIS